ncbi:unnamed protein product, partial [marine sediment metagenome]
EVGLSYYSIFLHAGIIMLGSQYLLRDIVKLGPVTIAIMVVFVFGSAALLIFIGRLFRADDSLIGVMAAGFSMCGVTAAVATAPMVRAKSEQITYAIAATVSFGVFCMIGLPYLARLFDITQYSFGVISATGVPNSAQVIATGYMLGFEAGKVSGFVNIGRVVLIPAGALFIYFLSMTREVLAAEKIDVWQTVKEKFPVYVFGFIIVWVANCFHFFPKPTVFAIEKVMIWFFSLSFVGLGLQTKLSDVRKAGIKGAIVGYLAGTIKLALAIIVISIFCQLPGLAWPVTVHHRLPLGTHGTPGPEVVRISINIYHPAVLDLNPGGTANLTELAAAVHFLIYILRREGFAKQVCFSAKSGRQYSP